jgi:hypothetical protein
MRERALLGYSAVTRCRLICGDIAWVGDNIGEVFDVIMAYGLLYHLEDPDAALEIMGQRCGDPLLMETCVSFGDHEATNPVVEPAANPSQAFTGMGCRPTRPWIFNKLSSLFDHVYVPCTQPAHDEFPLDWTQPADAPRSRAIFVASRTPLDNPLLLDHLPEKQMPS